MLPIIVIFTYLAIVLYIGIFAFRRGKTTGEDFFLAIEMIKWVDAASSGAEFAFSAALGYSHNEIYYRSVSEAPWKRASIGALMAGMQPKLSFYVTVND